MEKKLATQILVMAIVISVILLFLGIGVLVLIHVWMVGRTLRTDASERNTNAVERESMASSSMSRDDIEKKLPRFDFAAKAVGGSPAGDCAVCLDKFKVGERCRLLPSCNHSFHAECVDLWLLRTPICPICRAAAAAAEDEEGDGEREGEREGDGGGGGGGERERFEVVGILDVDTTREGRIIRVRSDRFEFRHEFGGGGKGEPRIDLRELVDALNAVDAGDVLVTAEMAVNEEKYVRDEA